MVVKDNITNFLGLGMRAGKVISGEESCRKALKKDAYLIVVAEDASSNTIKMFTDKCKFYKIPLRIIGTKEELGASIGKRYRAVVAIKDKKFATTLLELIDNTC